MISIKATIMLVRGISGSVVPKAAAQSDKHSKMAPVDQYLMERNAEILLAWGAGNPDPCLLFGDSSPCGAREGMDLRHGQEVVTAGVNFSEV